MFCNRPVKILRLQREIFQSQFREIDSVSITLSSRPYFFFSAKLAKYDATSRGALGSTSIAYLFSFRPLPRVFSRGTVWRDHDSRFHLETIAQRRYSLITPSASCELKFSMNRVASG